MKINVSLWQQEVLRAATADELLSTLQDYLVLFRPDELAQLPVPCQPASFATSADVSAYAAALLGHEGEDEADGEHADARETLTAFFVLAAHRGEELCTCGEARAEPVREAAEA